MGDGTIELWRYSAAWSRLAGASVRIQGRIIIASVFLRQGLTCISTLAAVWQTAIEHVRSSQARPSPMQSGQPINMDNAWQD